MPVQNEKAILDQLAESIKRSKRAREAAIAERIQRDSIEPIDFPRPPTNLITPSIPRIERQR